MPKILFVYNIENESVWKDGLSEAIKILEKKFTLARYNCAIPETKQIKNFDFVLGWGGFNSKVDEVIQRTTRHFPHIKKGLCLGGYGFPPSKTTDYDIYFYETPWSLDWLKEQLQGTNFGKIPEFMHAFGTNTNVFFKNDATKIWDYASIGSFARWKRHEKIGKKEGTKIVVGQIQRDNLGESLDIISNLLPLDVAISPAVSPETLANIYRSTDTVYIPADILGGGERALVEALHCGCKVEIESDNPKLRSLLNMNIASMDEHYYAQQLQKGIELCLKY